MMGATLSALSAADCSKFIRGLDDSHIRSSTSDIPGRQDGMFAFRGDLESRLIASHLPRMMNGED